MKIEIDMTEQEWEAVTNLLYDVPLSVIENTIPKRQWDRCIDGINKLRAAINTKLAE